MQILKLLSNSKNQLALTLILIVLSVVVYYQDFSLVLHFLLASLIAVLVDLLTLKIRGINLFFPGAAIVTGLIVALLHPPTAPIYQLFTITTVAILLKNLLRIGNRHIFNPAASGLFLGGVIFGQNVSWWGVSFQNLLGTLFPNLIYFLILLTPAIVSMILMRRFRITLIFLAVYILLFQLISQRLDFSMTINSLLDPTLLFFALVMLPEPMTSPHNHIRQLMFGGLVAIIGVLISFPLLNLPLTSVGLLPDSLILSLLIGNLIFFKFR